MPTFKNYNEFEKFFNSKLQKAMELTRDEIYEIPVNMDDKVFYNLMYEFIDLAKVKGLTVRQAQHLFETCADYVLESKLV